MAELQENNRDPGELSNIINGIILNVDTTYDNNRLSSDDDNDVYSIRYTEAKAPANVIDNIYQSMSKIIEALNTDNLILNQQVKKIRSDLEFVCNTVAMLKVENQEMISLYTAEINSLMEQLQLVTDQKNNDTIVKEFDHLQQLFKSLKHDLDILKAKQEGTADLQKQLLDTRAMLLQLISSNMQGIKKEITDVKKIKEDIRTNVKSIISEEIKEYIATAPLLEKRFEELAREQRASLSQHIRKSNIQRVSSLQVETGSLIDMIKQQIKETDSSIDVDQLKKQQIDFMEKIELMMCSMKEKIDKLSG